MTTNNSVRKKSVRKRTVKSVRKTSVRKTSVKKTSVRKRSVRKRSVRKRSVRKRSVRKRSVKKTSVKKTSVRKRPVKSGRKRSVKSVRKRPVKSVRKRPVKSGRKSFIFKFNKPLLSLTNNNSTNTEDYKHCNTDISSIYKNLNSGDANQYIKKFMKQDEIINIYKDDTLDKSYTYKKIGGGKSGALIYIIKKRVQKKEKEEEEQILKIYDNKKNLERNIREISVYCLFKTLFDKNRDNKLPIVPIMEETGIIAENSNMYKNTPYIITNKSTGEGLEKLLEKGDILKDPQVCYDIMKKILQNLLDINEQINFSHEDLHPGNIIIDIDKNTNKLKNVTFIDFDLAEIGDIHYEDNKINPIKRPFSRKLTRCVPSVLNESIEKVFETNKNIYKKFLERFNICTISSSIFKSDKEFNKIKLDRVAIMYYLFIFNFFILKYNGEYGLIKKLSDDTTNNEYVNYFFTHRDLIKKLSDDTTNNEYVNYFFTHYNDLIKKISDNTANIDFYTNAISRFTDLYTKPPYKHQPPSHIKFKTPFNFKLECDKAYTVEIIDSEDVDRNIKIYISPFKYEGEKIQVDIDDINDVEKYFNDAKDNYEKSKQIYNETYDPNINTKDTKAFKKYDKAYNKYNKAGFFVDIAKSKKEIMKISIIAIKDGNRYNELVTIYKIGKFNENELTYINETLKSENTCKSIKKEVKIIEIINKVMTEIIKYVNKVDQNINKISIPINILPFENLDNFINNFSIPIKINFKYKQ